MKVTYQAVVDTQRKVVRVYGRKLNATHDHVTYRAKQRPLFIEGLTANQMETRLAGLVHRGYRVQYRACCKGGLPR